MHPQSSILEIPGTACEQKYEILATGGPKQEKCMAFWRDLDLRKGCHMIVNLFSNVGPLGYSDWTAHCEQYWPL